MDRGTERDVPPSRGTGGGAADPPSPEGGGGPADAGRVPLAVVVVDREGLVSHWSTGARRIFGVVKEEAIGRPAIDLLPVSGALPEPDDDLPDGGYDGYGGYAAYDGLGPGLDSSLDRGLGYPAAGRARLTVPGLDRDRGRVDVLWWAYPLVGPGTERLLVLAADAAGLHRDEPADPLAVERIAPAFALHTDFPGAAELARRLPEILPSMSVDESARIVAQVLELGYPVLEFSQNDRVPVTPDWGVARRVERRERRERAARAAAEGAPIPQEFADDGEDLEYVAVRERLEFLNEVSGKIGTSLDLSRTILEVSRAVVPRFTDVAGTYLREQVVAGEGFPDGVPDTTTMWHRVALEHTDEPGRWDDVVPVGEAMPFPAHTPFFQCMTTGQPVLVPRISEQLGHAIASQFDKRDIRPLITGRSMLVVPLKARDVVLGFMILLRHPERALFNDMDRVTGAELAARAGLVLDNARMYTYQESVAETLQDSMLPHIPPRMAGLDIATRYLPGTLLGRVGGDWFDSVKLPGARTALVVGDVMGHGLNSAAMMGQLRTAVQTMAALDLPPAQLLRALDDLAQRLGDTYLATCLYAVYDPIGGELHLANAGHIPPVLVRAVDGRSELLDLPTGAPIGVGGVPFEAVRVRVDPGDRLVMCTDGLVEVRGEDIGVGLATLCESAAHPAASMDDACDTIIRALNTRGGRKDDVALLMARLNGIGPDDVCEGRFPLDPAEVGRARAVVREQLHDWGLAGLADAAALMVSELVTNAVRHSRRSPVALRLVRGDTLLCEVEDDGHELPTLLSTGPGDEAGRGLRVVSALAREWGTSRTGAGKTVWFELTLPRRSTGR
ncbi:SpoIIE family protein phosphatase [Streptomyces rishiriensis]|uniref:Serine phosphatase RsbU (Regulator of sigma subunit)/anti-sigma regulatory factor (Ser/Thr protein kinase) n=1 Tax=Streptomyces rishiriensis TaxID=68264 RepID=A0ABU0NZ25_STRRH|nr:SpoIIE family protein phosphatase [Streptomyces rishiriensis]MDQ0584374.1 serine phosphatase RsbU (regulator of sigma subunit)/anti-sigma regulatory factor (Ser/Thr protein kinase) [Streptomyces rishiriensis]